MKKLLLLLAVFFIPLGNEICAQYAIVYDKKTTAQAGANTASIVAAEMLTERHLKKSEEYQKKIQNNVLKIQGALELYRRSYENVTQFGNDNRNIKEIARLSVLIGEELKNTSIALKKNPKATIATQRQLISLTQETAQCVKTCYTLVSKSTAKSIAAQGTNANDGLNWLNPKDRLDVGNYLIQRLNKILFTLNIIKHQAEYANTWGKVFQEAAPYDWSRVLRQKETADDIIKAFSKR